jgi:hypothetical protein
VEGSGLVPDSLQKSFPDIFGERICFLIRYALRVPLHSEQPWLIFFVGPFGTFYHAIG